MTLTIDLKPEEEARLRSAARQRGIGAEECLRRLIAELPPAPPEEDKVLQLFARWEAEDATDDPAELAARREECEELEANLQANRVRFRVPAL